MLGLAYKEVLKKADSYPSFLIQAKVISLIATAIKTKAVSYRHQPASQNGALMLPRSMQSAQVTQTSTK